MDHLAIDLSGHQPGSTARARVGGKAATLARLRGLGLPVPACAAVPAGTPDVAIDAYAAGLAERFSGERVAVRSSAVAEDGDVTSFAGQFLTLLDVVAEPAPIADAVRRVRTSIRGVDGVSEEEMAVLVMPMVDAVVAGVAFTRDPVSGATVTLIEAIAGVADRLVAGEVDGERWRIQPGGSVAHDGASGAETVLTRDQAASIAELAATVESREGRPQDIEWAIDRRGDLRLLQARPITALADEIDVAPVPIVEEVPQGPWMWDSTHSRAPGTPLLASVFPEAMRRGSRRLVAEFGVPFDHLEMRAIGGYFHIQVVPPLGKPESSPPPAVALKLATRLHPAMRARERTARAALEEGRAARLHDEWIGVVRPEVEDALASWVDAGLTHLTDAALADRIAAAAELQREVFSWNMVTDPAYLLPLHALVAFLRDHGLGTVVEALELVAGSSPSEYLTSLSEVAQHLDEELVSELRREGPDPVVSLKERRPDLAAAFEQHRRVFGFRMLGYDYDAPTVGEDPTNELRMALALRGGLPGDPATARATARAAELREQLADGDARRFDRLVAEARRWYPVREEGEGVHARAGGAVRCSALEAGRRLVAAGEAGAPEHALLLELDELTGWLRAPRHVRALIERRRGERRWAELNPPGAPSEDARPPDPSVFTPGIRRMVEMLGLVIEHDAVEAEIADGADGVPASAGTYTGAVRVVSDPVDLDTVRPGEVLVAPLTTSAWEHVFSIIGALVCEGGGVLSHPAIIAREHALPAVVGCRGAVQRFRDGQIVTVDGSQGTVEPHG